MSQVQGTGHVGRWNDDRERFLVLVDICVEAAMLKPTIVYFRCTAGEIESIGYLCGFSVHECAFYLVCLGI